MPSRAICSILGVPYEDRAIFQQHTDAFGDLDAPPEERQRAVNKFVAYSRELVECKRHDPADDMISRLVAEHTGEDGFALDDLPVLIFFLVNAGYKTTANMLGLGTLALLLNDPERHRLCQDPALAASAAEEMLRYWSIVSDMRRIALRDVEIGGHLVRAGEGVIVSLLAANRCPEAFGSDAERIDIARNPRQHLAFGFGPHLCLGHNLARIELEVAWPRLFERIPDLRLATSVDEIECKQNSIAYGVKSLPVSCGDKP